MDQKLKAPSSDAGGENITERVSGNENGLSSTKVPEHIIRKQREKIKKLKLAKSPETEKLVDKAMEIAADKALLIILKDSLASVTNALKSYANALHKDRRHPLPFKMCQKEECIYGRATIDNAIGVVTKASRIEDINEELEEIDEPDPDDYHDGIDVCGDCDRPMTPHDDNPCRCIGRSEVDA